MAFGRNWLSVTLLLALAGSATAMAGAEAEGPDSQGVGSNGGKNSDALEVPLSVTAVDANALTRFRIETPQDLPTLTTSLTFGSQVLYGAPYIRGIGSDTTTLGTESSVALYVDGVY
jgi:hypothetical protein